MQRVLPGRTLLGARLKLEPEDGVGQGEPPNRGPIEGRVETGRDAAPPTTQASTVSYSPVAQSRHPFGETVVTAWHVERPETARVLAELERDVAGARQSGALLAAPGLGRTHLLRVFSERIDPTRWQCVYLPQARFDFTDLCRYIVATVQGTLSVDAPEAALRRILLEAWGEGRSLLVLFDDADSMPAETVRAWTKLTIEQVPGLLSLFVTRDEGIAPCVAALEEGAPIVRFTAPMSETETFDYIMNRLARTGQSPELQARFNEAVVERLHAVSGGVPVRLNTLAQGYLDMPGETPEIAWRRFSAWASRLLDLEGGPGPDAPDLGPEEAEGAAAPATKRRSTGARRRRAANRRRF